ncbi:hypothetical protein [Haliea sp.]
MALDTPPLFNARDGSQFKDKSQLIQIFMAMAGEVLDWDLMAAHQRRCQPKT